MSMALHALDTSIGAIISAFLTALMFLLTADTSDRKLLDEPSAPRACQMGILTGRLLAK